jgi:hypothetical protein
MRLQTTLSFMFAFGILLHNKRVMVTTFYIAIVIDIARWLFRKQRVLPAALDLLLVCTGMTLMVLAAYTGTPLIPLPEPDYSGAPALKLDSAFLAQFIQVDGGRFLFNLTIGMGVIQAGIFLAFSNERSSYLRRKITMAKLPPLGFRRLAAAIVLQIFLIFLCTVWETAAIIRLPLLVDPANALQSIGWRLAMTARYLVPCIVITLVAYWSWVQLNSIVVLSAYDHKDAQQ